ncbi:MAG: ROK family protein [Myxococcota bacterium]
MRTLAIDIGGTGLKMIVLDPAGEPLSERGRVPTPRPATPESVVSALAALGAGQPAYDRVSVGFPGVVVAGVTLNAPNLDGAWAGFPLAEALSGALGKPVRVANDADVQGYGAIEGQGVELTVTLGTGVGSGLFVDGVLVPNLELGHAPFRKGRSFEQELGKVALDRKGKKRWNARLVEAVDVWQRLFNPRRLYLGGGNTKKVNATLPDNVVKVANAAGLLGGIALWRH